VSRNPDAVNSDAVGFNDDLDVAATCDLLALSREIWLLLTDLSRRPDD